MPLLRPLLLAVAGLLVTFCASFVVGYVYEHQPEPDHVELVLVSGDSDPSAEQLISGVVRGRDGDLLVIETEDGILRIPLSGVTLEALLPVDDPAELPFGANVNLGGERSATERVITGLVVIESGLEP